MLFFVFVPGFMLAALLASVVWARRDHQLVAPAIGPIEVRNSFVGEGSLQGAAVAWRSLWPLVRVEAHRLVRHPASYLVVVPFLSLTLSEFQFSGIKEWNREDVSFVVYTAVPWAWGTLIASNLLTLRSRRWRSQELLATTPVPERSRTIAHLIATLAMLPGTALLLAAVFVAGNLSGKTIGSPRVTVLLSAPLLVVGGGCLGVAVARWLPRPIFGWVAVIATSVLQVNFYHADLRWRWLHFSIFSNDTKDYPTFSPLHHEAHLFYLLGGVLLVAAIALAGNGFSSRVVGLLAGALGLIVVSGFVQTRPIGNADAEVFAQRLEDPSLNQQCFERSTFTICADPVWADIVPHWSKPVEGVLARLSSQVIPAGLVVRQRPLIDVSHELPTSVAAKVDPAVVWPNDDEVSLSYEWGFPAAMEDSVAGEAQLSLGFRVASLVVGLPPDAWWSESSRGTADWLTVRLADSDTNQAVASPLSQCLAGTEGRAVVALWLAGQSTPAARGQLHSRAQSIQASKTLNSPVSFDWSWNYGGGFPDVLPEQGTVVNGSDVVGASALLQRDDASVAAMFQRHWAEIVAPAGQPITDKDVLGWFGLDTKQASAIVTKSTPKDHESDIGPRPAVFGTCLT
ncbi:MAG: hypothetical protein ACSLFB_01730 [Acidimicrobiales bacterium]